MHDRQDLYERDYYAWTRAQAAELRRMARARSNTPLDLDNLAEEVVDLGLSQRDAVRGQVRRILEHFLKLEWSPAVGPRRKWCASIAEARGALRDKLSPSLRRDLARRLPVLYADARRQAGLRLGRHGEHAAMDALPAACPYGLDEVLRDDWYPASRPGADGPGVAG